MAFLLCLGVVDITTKKDVGMIMLENMVAIGYPRKILIRWLSRFFWINQNGI